MNYNKLTPAQTERLAALMEECGEVIQAAGKILRHGWETEYKGVQYDNRKQLTIELGDLYAMMGRIIAAGDVDRKEWFIAHMNKQIEFKKWSHHQDE